MQLQLRDSLLFTSVEVVYRGNVIEIDDILVDTGSASTILAVDSVEKVGIFPETEDSLYIIRGVGGSEVVFVKQLDCLQIGTHKLSHFTIEVGVMDYGFAINGILGMDFLLKANAILNLNAMTIDFA